MAKPHIEKHKPEVVIDRLTNILAELHYTTRECYACGWVDHEDGYAACRYLGCTNNYCYECCEKLGIDPKCSKYWQCEDCTKEGLGSGHKEDD